jgi:antitoxin component YwqK of YwqJK toxin-antitoxin module
VAKLITILMPFILFIGCAKDDRPICPSCGERATMQMHPRMPGMGIKSYYKCDNEHNFTKEGVLVDVFGEPLKKESSFDAKLRSEGIDWNELEFREDIAYLKGSDIPYTGKYFAFWNNGNKNKGNYKDGKQEGLNVEWHENEQMEQKVTYKDGKLDGLGTTWHENGQMESEGNYKDGKREGLRVGWHSNGEKSSEVKYKDDKREGLGVMWYENGQKYFEANWKDGKEDGLFVYFYINGKKKLEINYKDGKKEGLRVRYHKNGQKKSEENYKGGKKVEGSIKYWNSKGEPVDTYEEVEVE